MQSDLTPESASAAPRTLNVNGREYLITPLTLDDYCEYTAWLKDRYVDEVRRHLDGLDAEDRRALLMDAIEKTRSMGHTRNAKGSVDLSPELKRIATEPLGQIRLLWMAMRRRQPDITPQDVSNLLTSESVIAQFMEQVEVANEGAVKKKRKAPGVIPTRLDTRRRR